jgi:hypothetical protein
LKRCGGAFHPANVFGRLRATAGSIAALKTLLDSSLDGALPAKVFQRHRAANFPKFPIISNFHRFAIDHLLAIDEPRSSRRKRISVKMCGTDSANGAPAVNGSKGPSNGNGSVSRAQTLGESSD